MVSVYSPKPILRVKMALQRVSSLTLKSLRSLNLQKKSVYSIVTNRSRRTRIRATLVSPSTTLTEQDLAPIFFIRFPTHLRVRSMGFQLMHLRLR